MIKIEDLLEYKRIFNDLPLDVLKRSLNLSIPTFDSKRANFFMENDGLCYYHNEGDIESGDRTFLDIHFMANDRSREIHLNNLSYPAINQGNRQGLVHVAKLLNMAHDYNFYLIKVSAISGGNPNNYGSYFFASVGGKPFGNEVYHSNSDCNSTEFNQVKNYFEYLQEKGIALDDRESTINTLYDISQDGRVNTSKERWLGRDYLSDKSWQGGFNLQDALQMRRVYRIINAKLRNLMIDVSENKNKLFSVKEISSLLGKTQAIGSNYEGVAKKFPIIFRDNSKALTDHPRSGVTPKSTKIVRSMMEKLVRMDKERVFSSYPEIAEHYDKLQSIVKFATQNIHKDSPCHAKLVALTMERSLGKEQFKKMTRSMSTEQELFVAE